MTRKRKLNPIFEPKTAAVVQDAVLWAEQALAAAGADLSDLIISAAHVSGYGKAVAHASSCGIIELTEGNSFSQIKMQRGGYTMRSEKALHGLVVHEVAHIIVGWAKADKEGKLPWSDGRHLTPSTHQCASWLWVCAQGWGKAHGININPDDLATVAEHDDLLRDMLSGFDPHFFPKKYVAMFTKIAEGKIEAPASDDRKRTCACCEKTFVAKHLSAKYCSTDCRTEARRQTYRKAKAKRTAAAAAKKAA